MLWIRPQIPNELKRKYWRYGTGTKRNMKLKSFFPSIIPIIMGNVSFLSSKNKWLHCLQGEGRWDWWKPEEANKMKIFNSRFSSEGIWLFFLHIRKPWNPHLHIYTSRNLIKKQLSWKRPVRAGAVSELLEGFNALLHPFPGWGLGSSAGQ